jgi:enoyl-CoA hydratase
MRERPQPIRTDRLNPRDSSTAGHTRCREIQMSAIGNAEAYQFLRVESHDEGRIVRILLNRPHVRNAQSRGLLVELNEAFLAAEADDNVRVVILGGIGPVFSAGHDLGSEEALAELAPGANQHATLRINGGTREGTEQRMLQEWHYYLENTRRWRNLRKITVAEVQGLVCAAGLMLMWACDLIVASDDAEFADPVGVRLGMCGVEYFGHPWEFGPRRAKELLLTGDSVGADEAYRMGMVSRVFPTNDLSDSTLQFARRIAARPTFTSLLVKESVNQTLDMMGFSNSLQACFNLHQINHAHWAEIHEDGYMTALPSDGVPNWKDAPRITRAQKDRA